MANIRVTCPACKTELELDASHEGQEVECGNCLEVFKAKGPGSSASGGGKIPGAAPRSGGGASGGGGSRGRSDRPAKKRRRDDDDDDYEHDRRRDDDDFDDYDPRPRRSSAGEGDGAATASLILGIISIVVCCCWPISLPVGLIACICGGLGLKSQNNKGMAIAGLSLGVIGMGLSALTLVGGFANRFN